LPTELAILLVIATCSRCGSLCIIAGREILLFDVGFAVGHRGIGRDPGAGGGEHILCCYREETCPKMLVAEFNAVGAMER